MSIESDMALDAAHAAADGCRVLIRAHYAHGKVAGAEALVVSVRPEAIVRHLIRWVGAGCTREQLTASGAFLFRQARERWPTLVPSIDMPELL